MNNMNPCASKSLKHSSQLIYMMNECINQKVINKAAGKVYLAIASYWGPKSRIYPSRETLAKICEYKHVRNITLQTAVLEKLSLISFTQKRIITSNKKYVGQNNVYRIDYSSLQSLYALAIQKKRKSTYNAKIKQQREDQKLDRELVKVIHTNNKIDPPNPNKIDPPFSMSISKHRSVNNNANRMDLFLSDKTLHTSCVNLIISKAKQQKKNGIIKLKQINAKQRWRIKMGLEFAKNDVKKLELDKQDTIISANRNLIDSNTLLLNKLTALLSRASLYGVRELFTSVDLRSLKRLCGGDLSGIMKLQAKSLGYN